MLEMKGNLEPRVVESLDHNFKVSEKVELGVQVTG